jgi:hypothetical protein
MKTFKEFFTEKKSDLRTEATAWVILYTSDKVMLGKRAPTTKNPNQWNFFGGHLDKGETAVQAAVRELKEETGYTMSVSKLKEILQRGLKIHRILKLQMKSVRSSLLNSLIFLIICMQKLQIFSTVSIICLLKRAAEQCNSTSMTLIVLANKRSCILK